MISARPRATVMPMNEQPVEQMDFETALAELETIVRTLEQGDEPLDRSIALYQRAETLKKHCETRLKSARERIEKITLDADGNPAGAEPFDAG